MAQKIKILDEINETVKKLIPSSAGITKIEMEGPEVVIYTRTPEAFFGVENYVSKIAFELKKRVNIRTDKSLLSNPEQAKKKILELVPKEAEVRDIYFEEPFSEVVIEAVKKGLVIGKGGELSKKIIMETGWTPRILRAPTTKSDILTGIRKHLFKHSDERKKFLLKTAEKIYSEKENSTHQWIRLIALGGYREVGRSCMLLETETTKVLLDAGLNHSSDDPFPFIDALGYPLSEIDAVVIALRPHGSATIFIQNGVRRSSVLHRTDKRPNDAFAVRLFGRKRVAGKNSSLLGSGREKHAHAHNNKGL